MIDIWKDTSFRQRVKLTVAGLSFYDPLGNKDPMAEYISAIENFDPNALDDDLSSIGDSSVPALTSAQSTPSATPPRGSSSTATDERPRQRARHS